MSTSALDEAQAGTLFDRQHFDAVLAAENVSPSFARVTDAGGAKNRRRHHRLGQDQCRWLTAARLKYGPELGIVDVSAGGMQVETTEPLTPQSRVVIEVLCPDSTIVVPSRVLRCEEVAGRAGRYRCAIAFARPLSIPALLAPAPPITATATAATAIPAAPQEFRKTPPPAVTRREPTPAGNASPCSAIVQKVVARFLDGHALRGYTNNFHTSRSQLHIAPDHGAKPTLVELRSLKAIFFVRDFEGDATRVENSTFVGAPVGRKIEVTFADGEILIGSTMSYRYDGTGFFVQPADPASNNLRVFVILAAVRHVRFLPK
jgi:PilZ domain